MPEEKGLMNEITTYIFAFVLFMLMVNFAVWIHEFIGHTVLATLLGCVAVSKTMFFIGATQFECAVPTAEKNILIALGGPVISYLIGLWLWRYHKDSLVRAFGLIEMLYSSVPSLYPTIAISDAAKATTFGASPVLVWLLFIFITGHIAKLVFSEIIEREFRI